MDAAVMWDHLPVRNLIHMQRLAAVHQVGQKVKELHDEGYTVDADRLLDELNERRQKWLEEEAA